MLPASQQYRGASVCCVRCSFQPLPLPLLAGLLCRCRWAIGTVGLFLATGLGLFSPGGDDETF